MTLTLVIANKAYSSWSFRPWILMRHFAIPFGEITIPLDLPETRQKILEYSPTGKCPCLIDGDLTIWDSLAIVEYLAENFRQFPIWPENPAARARARSLSAEMHAGFGHLRAHLPMNMRRPVTPRALPPDVLQDMSRIEAAFAAARRDFGAAGSFLFGHFCAADAMFAPMVNRLHVYDCQVSKDTRAYMSAMMALPSYADWQASAAAEGWRIEKYDRL